MMTHKGTIDIKTERTLLRKIVMEDAKTFFTYGDWGETQEEANSYIEKLIEPYSFDDYYHWGIEYENKIVGRVKVNEISHRDNFVELAYDIAPDFRCRGLMTEAVQAVIKFLFNEINVNRIYEHIRVNNHASNRVVQKIGMKLEGVLRNHFIESDGSYTDVNIYGLLKDEYPTE